jgi:hypothetical protein
MLPAGRCGGLASQAGLRCLSACRKCEPHLYWLSTLTKRWLGWCDSKMASCTAKQPGQGSYLKAGTGATRPGLGAPCARGAGAMQAHRERRRHARHKAHLSVAGCWRLQSLLQPHCMAQEGTQAGLAAYCCNNEGTCRERTAQHRAAPAAALRRRPPRPGASGLCTCVPVICCLMVPVVLVGHSRGVPAQGGRGSPQCGAQEGAQGACQLQRGASKLPGTDGQHGGVCAAENARGRSSNSR